MQRQKTITTPAVMLELVMSAFIGYAVTPLSTYAAHTRGIQGELATLVTDVAANRITTETYISGLPVRGVYLGEYAGCPHVGIVEPIDQRRHIQRTTTFRVCSGAVQPIGDGLSPSYPGDPDARAILERALRGALLYGTHVVRFQAYTIRTVRLGVPSSRPCHPVETTITFDGQLSLHRIQETCH